MSRARILGTRCIVCARGAVAGIVTVLLLLPAIAAGQSPQPEDEALQTEVSEGLATEEALARYQMILQRRPFHNPAFAGLVKHFAERGELQKLIQEYEQKAGAMPDDAAMRIVLVRLYLRGGRPEDAAAQLDGLGALPQAKEADERQLLVLKAEVFQRTGRVEEAQAILAQALQGAPSISEKMKLAEALADLHLRARQPDEAAAVLLKLAEAFPDNYLHRKRIADALAHRDLHEQAVDAYRQILALVRDQTDKRCEVLRQLGLSLEHLERRQDAIDVYTEALNLLSSGHWLQAELHERIVSLYRASGRLADLAGYCRDQIRRAPEQTSMRSLLAEVLAASGDGDGAKETLTEAVQLFPADRSLSEKRIEILERLRDADGVAAEYQRAIGQHLDDAELYIAYGQFLANNRQLEAARNQWKHVLNSELADAELSQRLGGLFEAYDLLDDAVECYERAITLDPTSHDSYTALSKVWVFRGDRDKAIESLHRMAAANPDDAATQAALCQALLSIGKDDEALAAIARAVELEPQQFRHRLMQSDLLVQEGRLEEALEVRRAAIDLINNSLQQSQAVEVLASMYYSADRLPKLVEAETQRLQAEPGNVASLLLLARAADLRQEFASARAWLQRLLAADPMHEEASLQLARILEATGDLDAATDLYRKLIDLHPARGRPFYQAIADLKIRYEDRAGAIAVFDELLKSSPDNATVLKSVAEQLARLGEQERAITCYEQSLQLQPDRPEVRLDYGKALREAGRLDEAQEAFKATALQSADRDSARAALGLLHETAGELGTVDTVIEELQARVEANPEATDVARALAELLVREFDYARALELLDIVLLKQPRDLELAIVRGEILRRLVRFDDALETYRRILRVPGVDRDFVLGEMGKACFEAGRLEQARRYWRQVEHKLYAGSLLQNNGLLDDAVQLYQEGIRLKPDDFALHRNLIRALAAAGRTDEALDAARRLLDLEPDNVMNIEGLAEAWLERGDRAAAADIAGRLFSAGVVDKQPGSRSAGRSMMGGLPLWALSMQSSWWRSFNRGPARNNLERAVAFFLENSLIAELKDILIRQAEAQPENAVLRLAAADLFAEQLAEPEPALKLYRELETAGFPLEHQQWLGQCSQRDFMRVRQYELIAGKPSLRDRRLAELEAIPDGELARDEILELAVIRRAQGVNDEAAALLMRAADADPDDLVAASALVDQLIRAERFTDAEPYVLSLCDRLAAKRREIEDEMVERVRRDFVRSLPIQFQFRLNEDLLRDIARKWTLGQGFVGDYTGNVRTTGYFAARMALATIYAETDRMAQARTIWEELAPSSPADADGWTMLAGVAQLHDQDDLAYAYYEKALGAAKLLAEDPLLQRIYGGSVSQTWWGFGQETIDSSFNKIVEAFAGRDKLVELYDFLRETDQVVKARRVAEQYDLHDRLKALYRDRLEAARQAFLGARDGALLRSVPYFVQTCKLAELYDATGAWDEAVRTYEGYLHDFPDELGLLETLGEAAEVEGEYDAALQVEKRILESKERLSRRAREWNLREIPLTPGIPTLLVGEAAPNMWPQRWGKFRWYGYRAQDPLARWTSWIRIARLQLAMDNAVAAGNAMERAIGSAGTERKQVAGEILGLIQERQLTTRMLPVLRALAVHLPTDEQAQLAFAEALQANGRADVAAEVYQRLVRRGVSNLGVLAQVRHELEALHPQEPGERADGLAAIEAEVAAAPDDVTNRLRLAKAYYYSLRVDEALAILQALAESAPQLEDLHDLLIEIYTVRGDSDQLVEALRAQVKRTTDTSKKSQAQQRLAQALLAAGRSEEALEAIKQLADPRNAGSYQQVSMLLHYFGRHDEAIAAARQGGRSQNRMPWGGDVGDVGLAKASLLKGDIQATADNVLEAVQASMRQMQQAGAGSLYAAYDYQQNPFAHFSSLFVLEPALTEEVSRRLTAARESKPDDLQTAKILMQFHQTLGHDDRADSILQELAGKGATDQSLVSRLIDRATARRDFATAIKLAEDYIAQQPKPKLPPGMPPQFASMAALMSPRNIMLCTLGDLHRKTGDTERAFESYRQIIDEDIDATRIAYAWICILNDRPAEAAALVDDSLAAQQVKVPAMLQSRAMVAALQNEPEKVFDDLASAMEIGGTQDANPFGGGEGAVTPTLLGVLAARTGLVDRFSEAMEHRLEKNPHDWETYDAWAKTLYDAGRPAEAFAILDRAATVKALATEAIQQKLQWMEGHAGAQELIPLYERLIELADREADATSRESRPSATDPGRLRQRLGDLLWDQGQAERAVEVWTQRSNPKEAATHLSLAQRLMEKDAHDQAEQAFLKSLEVDPDNATAHRALAQLAFQRGDNDAALDHLVEAFLSMQRSGRRTPDMQRGYQYQYVAGQGEPQESDQGLRVVAMNLARDPALTARLRDEPGPKAAQARLALAVLTGDWAAVETGLAGVPQYDPMAWSLWAGIHERRGDWEQAARAAELVWRINQTTLPRHHQQLALVLAGKQVREAAAGTRQAPAPTPAMPMPGRGMTSYSYYGYPGYYDQNSIGADSRRLAALYVKLKRYEQAERLYLLSGQSNVIAVLPMLAGLVWEGGGQERALELMRLSVIFAEGGNLMNLMPQYAAMLAEAGDARAAADLLVRAYRAGDPQSQQYGGMSAMLYGWYRGSQDAFEQGQEDQLAAALHQLLRHSGTLDQVLGELGVQAQENPDDMRLTKLVLSLHIRDGRWREARRLLESWREARPWDSAVRGELLRACLQLEDWNAALALVEELRSESPQNQGQWRLSEAFIRLMQGDPEAAAAAVDPLLDDLPSPSAMGMMIPGGSGPAPHQVSTALAAARDYDRLRRYLERLDERGLLDDAGGALLIRLHHVQGRWADAANLAFDRIWKESRPLDESSTWYRLLAATLNGARAGGASLQPALQRPEDVALLQLLSEGPGAARPAFAQLVREQPDNCNARRGLVFATALDGDDAQAAGVNRDLIDWLAPRRPLLWQPAPKRPIGEMAGDVVKSMKAGGANTASALGMSMQGGSLLQSLSGGAFEGFQQQQPETYESLWSSHQALQRDLLLRAGEREGFVALVRAQTSNAGPEESPDPMRRMSYSRAGQSSIAYQRAYLRAMEMSMRGGEQARSRDWQQAMRDGLAQHALFEPLAAHLEGLGMRIAPDQWLLFSETLAALGRSQDAARWRSQAADLRLVELRAAEGPDLGTAQPWAWGSWWRIAGSGNRAQQVRAALAGDTAGKKDDRKDSVIDAKADELWELALLDPHVEAGLRELAENISPGWGSSKTMAQLIAFERAGKRPQRVIELIDRVFEVNELLESQWLTDYVRACYEAADQARLERVLAAATALSPTLENDVLLARLVSLRRLGRDGEAAALEEEALSRCTLDPPNPFPIEPALRQPTPEEPGSAPTQVMGVTRFGSRMPRNYPWFRAQQADEVPTVGSLASALGVRYGGRVKPDDLTVRRLRVAYARNGLHEHAARLLERELAESGQRLDARQRAALLAERADQLAAAGRAAEARTVAEEAETLLRREAGLAPTDTVPVQRLARMYAGPALGPDYLREYEALQAVAVVDGQDEPGVESARCLFELGRNEEAWNGYQRWLHRGRRGYTDAGTLYRAGLAAQRAGRTDEAGPLLRQALWRDPLHELAGQAREVIHE